MYVLQNVEDVEQGENDNEAICPYVYPQMNEQPKDATFLFLKWLLFIIALIPTILLMMVLLSISIGIELDYLNHQNGLNNPNGSIDPIEYASIVAVILVLCICIHLIGVFGAIKENYRLIISYGVIMLFCFVAGLSHNNRGAIYPFLVAILSFTFASKIASRKERVALNWGW
jgi:hypothetical protein